MKLRAPPGCGAASHGGERIEIDTEGCVIVEDPAAHALRAHGFLPLSEAEARCDAPPRLPHTELSSEKHDSPGDEIEGLNRRGLFAFLKAKGVGVTLPVTNDELRALARRANEGPQ
ncbi:hypothetical protein [Methyloferula stellata]|uniref:hypothetical protein n=1 Tax=Methyloferula stellata TaxID=876270 RepID=UPI00036D8AC5|nr:hypothetical protein [Methyloferula stellata]